MIGRLLRVSYRNSLLRLLSVAVIAAASPARALDTAKLDQARSAVAEAATVSRAEARGQVTGVYADGVREGARNNLQKLLKEPELKAVVGEALRALDVGDVEALAGLQARLTALERAHGRAG